PPRLNRSVRQSMSHMRQYLVCSLLLVSTLQACKSVETTQFAAPPVLKAGAPREPNDISVACEQTGGLFQGTVIGIMPDGRRLPIRGVELVKRYAVDGPLYPVPVTTNRAGHFRYRIGTTSHTYRVCRNGAVDVSTRYDEMDLVVRAQGCVEGA